MRRKSLSNFKLSLRPAKAIECIVNTAQSRNILMPPHILVIDDQISLPRFIEMELQSAGYRVSLSCYDRFRLPDCQIFKPDLILLNWELRCTSSLSIYRQLRSVDRQVPIVIITTEDVNHHHLASERAPAVYLTKPFSISDLLAVIKLQLKVESVAIQHH